MPGYLSHLAARVFGSKPAVRPRIASLFEPVTGAASPGEPVVGRLQVVEQERVIPQPPAAAPAEIRHNTQTSAPDRTTTVLSARDSQPVPLAPPDPRPAERQELEFHQILTPPPARGVRQREAVSPPDPHLTAAERTLVRPEFRPANPAEESHALQSRSTQQQPKPPAALLRPSHEEQAERLRVRTVPAEPRVEPLHALPERAAAAPPVQVSATLVPQGEPHPQLNPLERFPPFAESSVHQPSVQVTIGKLIVEAVASPPPTLPPVRASRATGPRLSLDDYLRQRRSQA